jgi:hydroxyacylglutathione hydrolase
MLEVRQFRYSADNFAYLIYGEKEALAVDGGAVHEICAFLAQKGLALLAAANTHAHPDHTVGTLELARETGAPVLDGAGLRAAGTVTVEGVAVAVLKTPGHTMDSVCFHGPGFLLSGDTLFNGTVGNCFSGDLAAFYRSIVLLMSLPPETRVFAGHDYVRDSLAYALFREPDNAPAIRAYQAALDPALLFSSLAMERAVNPYLRFDEPKITTLLMEKGMPAETPEERFVSLMRLG